MRRRFEVKREMRDAGIIRSGDADNQKNYMTSNYTNIEEETEFSLSFIMLFLTHGQWLLCCQKLLNIMIS